MDENKVNINLAAEGKAEVTIISAEKRIHQFVGYSLALKSTQSIVDWIKSKGSKEATLVFFNDKNIGVILDQTVMDRPQDTASYSFAKSDIFQEWEPILGRALKQKDFIDFLKRRTESEMKPYVLDGLIAKVQNLKIATSIVGDYSYDDNNNFTVMFKTADGEDQIKLPSLLEITIPILNDGVVQAMELELQLNKPKQEDEKPTFVLTCPKYSRYYKVAVDHEVDKLKAELDGYLILQGNF